MMGWARKLIVGAEENMLQCAEILVGIRLEGVSH